MTTPLEIITVSKKFKDANILDNVSFNVLKNEIFGLVGLNGVGKTTLIKIILGLLKAGGGNVKMFGKSNSDLEAKAQIAYLPEKFNPSTYLKGEEFLSLSIGYYGMNYNSSEAHVLCEQLDLDPKVLKKRISSYSKGMGQKLGLISVFLTKAPLLILDEPMSGLDPSARIVLKQKLLAYKQAGNSVFFSSHILADIEEICDRIGVINNGSLIFEGSSKDFIVKYPANTLEQSFLKSINN